MNIKWIYMDHWRSVGPAGAIDQWHDRTSMSRFLKQIKACGFDAIDTFDFRIWQILGDYGSPATLYYDMEPVTPDKIKTTAELWNQVGEITLQWGVKLTCHHEFFCGIQSREELDLFSACSDPRYVNLFVDTAQHCIASVDPVDFYTSYADRVTGSHFKDTRNVAAPDDLPLVRRTRPVRDLLMSIRWGYAIDQWKPQFDDFVRRRDHERALKTIAIAGFSGVQLTSGTGRWQPLGNPHQVEANFGSLEGLADFVRSCALDCVAAWVLDPTQGFQEDLSQGADPRDPEQHKEVNAKASWFAEALARTGGDVLVARPAPSGQAGPAGDTAIAAIAACWNTVGQASAKIGVRTALRFDFLSCLRLDHGWDRLLAALDPAYVGVALDTGELAAAGRDPLTEIEHCPLPIQHVILSNALARDDLEEFTRPGAEFSVRRSGGSRGIPRWFGELEEPGLVDAEAIVAVLGERDYHGWVVVNTAPSPHAATSTLLSGYHVQRVLGPLNSTDRRAAWAGSPMPSM